jgi:hypothetical protein
LILTLLDSHRRRERHHGEYAGMNQDQAADEGIPPRTIDPLPSANNEAAQGSRVNRCALDA